jgi:inward rectifier potassium channel
MQKPSFDPGLTQQVTGNLSRAINPDGSFNVERRGTSWRYIHPYLHLINAHWSTFLGIVLAAYLIVNSIFATIYFALPADQIQGTAGESNSERFMNDFFFSAHTLTTVGYGNFAPKGVAANSVAALEAMTGLMGFALATGVLFGRVSKPSARIGFSKNILVTPYQDRTSLQFRIVNLRSNTLIDLQATVMLMTIEGTSGKLAREFKLLTLERERIYFFPVTWNVVHPIDEASPLFGKTPEDLARLRAEILILIKGFDDTFSQTVNARYSYRHDEIVWDAKFCPAFNIDDSGRIVLELTQLSSIARTKTS